MLRPTEKKINTYLIKYGLNFAGRSEILGSALINAKDCFEAREEIMKEVVVDDVIGFKLKDIKVIE